MMWAKKGQKQRKECLHWSDSEQGYCEGWDDWEDWKDVISNCSYVADSITVKGIAMRVCEGKNSGSKANIKAIIINADKEECSTDPFDYKLNPKDYYETRAMGNCTNFEIKENIAKVWLVNQDSTDSLCLKDVYLDVSSSLGSTSM